MTPNPLAEIKVTSGSKEKGRKEIEEEGPQKAKVLRKDF